MLGKYDNFHFVPDELETLVAYANGKILSVAGGSGYEGDRYLPNAWLVYE